MGIPIIEASNTTKIQALTDILVSISLEEAAVAHILNAEGEKLQKIIADEYSTNKELLCANQSVDDLADTLTNLVMLLKSKMRLVLTDKCYARFCDDLCKDFKFILEAEPGTITPIGKNEYTLVVEEGTTYVDVTVTSFPQLPVTITNVVGVDVNATAVAHVITITPIDEPFEGTVTATLHLPNGCKRDIIIHVIEQAIPCPEYELLLTETNGELETEIPQETYNLFISDPTTDATVQFTTDPESTVTVISLIKSANINVTLTAPDTLTIESPITDSGFVAAVVSFGEGCERTVLINVFIPE